MHRLIEPTMQQRKKFSITDRIRSFRFAFTGLADLILSEHNFRIHLIVLILVIAAGFLFGISPAEWIAVIVVSAIVMISEALNSSLEQLADLISPGQNEKVKKAKDMAAAAVLIAALASVITGLIIFLPRLYRLFTGF